MALCVVILGVVAGDASVCCGVASGTSLRRKPDVHPQGKIHLMANIIEKYQGMSASFSFLRTASIMRSATSFEFSVFTHLRQVRRKKKVNNFSVKISIIVVGNKLP